jgi:hypothetical protein
LENQSPEDQILNFEGPADETMFRGFVSWCLPEQFEEEAQKEVDSVFAHLATEDNRALALIGALVIENAIDGFLNAHIPGYTKLKDKKDFTFSMKINLARALKLCPSRLFGAADTIRDVRNDFAHKLSISLFSECKPEHLRSLEGHLRQITSNELNYGDNRTIFKTLVTLVYLALRGYTLHIYNLNEYIRDIQGNFIGDFEKYCKANYASLGDTQRA